MDPLDRIAAALERLSPPPPAGADPLAAPAYLWRGDTLAAAQAWAALPLDRLLGVDSQKAALLANVRKLAGGRAAHDALLWGARGTGKSALAKAAVAAVQASGGEVALIEVATIDTLPALFAHLATVPRAFVLFVDDLGFDTPGEARALRSLLEGGAEARPDNARLVVTANRRHLLPRDFDAAAINPRDAADDQLALADRFGLSLGFHVPDQAGYLAIVAAHAAAMGLAFDPDEALRWAAARGSRSGRTAWQYVVEVAGR